MLRSFCLDKGGGEQMCVLSEVSGASREPRPGNQTEKKEGGDPDQTVGMTLQKRL